MPADSAQLGIEAQQDNLQESPQTRTHAEVSVSKSQPSTPQHSQLESDYPDQHEATADSSAKVAEQGAVRLRPQAQLDTIAGSQTPQPPGQASSHAADGMAPYVQQQAEQPQKRQRHHKVTLPPLVLGSNELELGAHPEASQGLRRRFSFKKTSKGEGTDPRQSPAVHSLSRQQSEAFAHVAPAEGDRIEAVARSGSSFLSGAMSLMKHRSGKVMPEDDSASDMNLYNKIAKDSDEHSDVLAAALLGQQSVLPSHKVRKSSSSGRPSQRVKKTQTLITSEALQHTCAQVNACTLQLQEQQHEQQSMQQVLQIMNAHIAAMLDNYVHSMQSHLS